MHRATWLPLHGIRCRLCLPMDVGQCAMVGSSPRWEKSLTRCTLCGKWHSGTPHGRLVQCPQWCDVFLHKWAHTWGPWESYATAWMASATTEEMLHIAGLRIPETLVEAFFSWLGIKVSLPTSHFATEEHGVHAHRLGMPTRYCGGNLSSQQTYSKPL